MAANVSGRILVGEESVNEIFPQEAIVPLFERQTAVRNLPSFNAWMTDMQTFKFSAGDTILSEGDVGQSAYLITTGSVEVLVGKGTSAKRVGTLGPGEMFGEMSLIDSGPRSATVKAMADTECVVSTYAEFIASIQQHPDQAIEFMKALVRRLRQINKMVAGMDPGKRRLRDVLIDWQTDVFENSDYVQRRVNNTFI